MHLSRNSKPSIYHRFILELLNQSYSKFSKPIRHLLKLLSESIYIGSTEEILMTGQVRYHAILLGRRQLNVERNIHPHTTSG